MMRTTVAMALPIVYARCMDIKEYLRSELKIKRREYFRSLSRLDLKNIESQFIANTLSLNVFRSLSYTIGCYYSVRDEVPTIGLIQALWQKGFQVTLPHVLPDLSMSFHAYHPGDQLEVAAFRIPQPSRESQILIPDVLIVPMLGFNRDGHRIGYGQGHYDRTLHTIQSKGSITTIGLAFSCQEVSDTFAQEYDVELDWIITESELIQRPTLMHVKGML
jgi:5-formyltetrahydrofolate cyclo-ligase